MSLHHSVEQKSLDDRTIVAFCESFLVWKPDINLIIYNSKKYLYSVFIIYVC